MYICFEANVLRKRWHMHMRPRTATDAEIDVYVPAYACSCFIPMMIFVSVYVCIWIHIHTNGTVVCSSQAKFMLQPLLTHTNTQIRIMYVHELGFILQQLHTRAHTYASRDIMWIHVLWKYVCAHMWDGIVCSDEIENWYKTSMRVHMREMQ